ncbi:MAG: efflux RND transporter periplasmic adaptor subunit [Selenomonadaceae bacterium]|nr:efflux RND transporter periplasmic adaptor subunit [Selenomonadaceae bacterium]
MKKRLIAAAALSVIVGFGLVAGGCGGKKEEAPKERVVAVVKVGDSRQETAVGRFAATIKGRYETRMSFQVAGQINNRIVNVGDRVEKGAVLLTIDPKDVGQKLREADAAVNKAAAAYDLAESNYRRFAVLAEQGAISQVSYDNYRAQYESAAATLAAAEAQRAEAGNAMSYTELKADRDGVVASLFAEAGQVVAAGQSILTLVGTDELEAEINVPETRVASVKVGDKAVVYLWSAGNDKKMEGVVREVAPMADSISGTYRVRVAIKEQNSGMALGMTASVELPGLSESKNGGDVYTIPLSAVYQNGESPQVWVVRDSRTVRVPIKIIAAGNDEVKISGIKAGEQVVIKGVHRLREDETVRISGQTGNKP